MFIWNDIKTKPEVGSRVIVKAIIDNKIKYYNVCIYTENDKYLTAGVDGEDITDEVVAWTYDPINKMRGIK